MEGSSQTLIFSLSLSAPMLVFEWNAMPNNFIGFWLEFIVGWKSFFQTFFSFFASTSLSHSCVINESKLLASLHPYRGGAMMRKRKIERTRDMVKKKSLQRSKNRVNFYWIEENLVWGEKRKHHKKNERFSSSKQARSWLERWWWWDQGRRGLDYSTE